MEQQDVISRMPEKVITNILHRLPIQEAVRTGILARNWQYKWNKLTRLVFDEKFSKYLQGPNGEESFDERTIGRILLSLKGPVTMFYLYIPSYKVLNKEINHWVLLLSTKGVKEIIIKNMHQTPLLLKGHLFCCLELEHLRLANCSFHVPRNFCGFPKLLKLLVDMSCNCYTVGKLITLCPSLEELRVIRIRDSSLSTVKPTKISILENLKVLFFELSKLDIKRVTCSKIFQFLGCLPKLQELRLDLNMCELWAEAGAGNEVSATSPCLKILGFASVDFGSSIMLSFMYGMICRSPNLQNLEILAQAPTDFVQTRAEAETEFDTTRQLQQLLEVNCYFLKGSNNEVCFIKSLLACSPILDRISIGVTPFVVAGSEKWCKFMEKLLQLHRASPVAGIFLF